MLEGTAVLWEEFLSTPSARRATCNAWSHGVAIGISIHALREEGDDGTCGRGLFGFDFYPRPPRGGRRVTTHKMRFSTTISIHALREEGDLAAVAGQAVADDFYPRPPRGGRQDSPDAGGWVLIFLSTPSARRATCQPRPGSRPDQFLSTPSARRATLQLHQVSERR